jgi:hypothetical protein
MNFEQLIKLNQYINDYQSAAHELWQLDHAEWLPSMEQPEHPIHWQRHCIVARLDVLETRLSELRYIKVNYGAGDMFVRREEQRETKEAA